MGKLEDLTEHFRLKRTGRGEILHLSCTTHHLVWVYIYMISARRSEAVSDCLKNLNMADVFSHMISYRANLQT